jgi:hypothetical protein
MISGQVLRPALTLGRSRWGPRLGLKNGVAPSGLPSRLYRGSCGDRLLGDGVGDTIAAEYFGNAVPASASSIGPPSLAADSLSSSASNVRPYFFLANAQK